MAVGFFVTNAVAQSMLNAFTTAADAGTAAVINIYEGAIPADADAADATNKLAQLTCSSVSFGAATDLAPGARITANAISSDTSADSTGTATHFRLLTQDAGTVLAQGTVGVGTFDLALNTVSITSGSTVAITAATITLPEG
jgi:hypothetical protein